MLHLYEFLIVSIVYSEIRSQLTSTSHFKYKENLIQLWQIEMPADIQQILQGNTLMGLVKYVKYENDRYYHFLKTKQLREKSKDPNKKITKGNLLIKQAELEINSTLDYKCYRFSLKAIIPEIAQLEVLYRREFVEQMHTAVRIANFLSRLFRNFDYENRDSFRHLFHDGFYYSLAKSNVESDKRILGFGFVFLPNFYLEIPLRKDYSYRNTINNKNFRAKTMFYPYAFREVEPETIRVKDLSRQLHYKSEHLYSTEWFHRHLYTDYSYLFKRVVNSSFNGKFEYEEITISEPSVSDIDGFWTAPYFDCKGTYFWKITYSIPVFHQTKFMCDGLTFLITTKSKKSSPS